jgi:hypothetical protein
MCVPAFQGGLIMLSFFLGLSIICGVIFIVLVLFKVSLELRIIVVSLVFVIITVAAWFLLPIAIGKYHEKTGITADSIEELNKKIMESNTTDKK